MRITALIFFLLASLNMLAQTASFLSNDHLATTRYDKYEWIINGQSIKPQTKPINIKINYPDVDTIIFLKTKRSKRTIDTVLTRFRPKKKYIFTISCCDDNYDIHYQKEINQFEKELKKKPEEYHQIRHKYLSLGKLKVIGENIPDGDSLLLVYDTPVMFENGVILTSTTKPKYFVPLIVGYTNLEFDVSICPYTPCVDCEIIDGILECLDVDFYSKLKPISKIRIRVFANDKAELFYDYEANKFRLRFEK